MSWTHINNRKNFLLKEIPSYHPASSKYIKFWKSEKKKIIEGYWGPDDESIRNYDVHENSYTVKSSSWRYMPPQLYFYINYGTILHNEEGSQKSAPKKKMKPYLRDVEWEFFYNWLEARGFSGFTNDEEFTCNIEVRKHEKGEDLVALDKTCYKKDNTLKKYIPAREYLRRLFDKPLGVPVYMNEAQNLFMLGARGFGKDLIHSTLLHYKDGKKPISKVKIGDEVYGADGRLTKVVDRFDYDDQEQFEITLSDKRKITSGLGHIWGVYERKNKEFIYKELELKDIYKNYLIGKRKDSRYFIQQNKAIIKSEKNFFIHPYVLGSILGDGGITQANITFTTADVESVNTINKLLKNGYKLHKRHDKYTYVLRKENHNAKWKNEYTAELERLGLMYHHTKDKFIPSEYINSSIDQRVALLQGLLDTDGYINEHGNIEFVTISKRLASDFIEVARSLGIVVTTNTSDYKTRIYLKTDLPLFKLQRKLKKINKYPSKYAKTNRNFTAIRNIKSVGVQKSVCISVDNNDKLFIADDYVVTHNSYMVGVGVVLHELITDGAKIYNQESIENPATVEVFVGAALSSKSSDILNKTVTAFREMPGVWMKDTEEEIPNPLFKEMSGTLEPNNMKNAWRHDYMVKINGSWRHKGTGSNIKHGIYTTDNPEAAAGTRPGVMVVEEVGLLGNVLLVHASNEYCQIEGTTKFGSTVYLGTGGNMEKIVESEIIFRDPESYGFLAFDDEWEGKGQIGWFVPAYYGLNQFKDKNGNTDIEKSLKFLEKVREKKRKARSSTALILEMMSRPIKPSEMFIRRSGGIFPIEDLKDVLSDLESNETLLSASWKARFSLNKEGTVKYENSDKKPIINFPLKRGDSMLGAVEIFEMPKRDKDNNIPSGRYIAGTDPVDDDDNEDVSLSLQSTFVLDTWTDRIVAEYTERTYLAEEYYETLRRLLIFYNAKTNYEQNKKGLYGYFKNHKSLHLLAETPQIISDQDLVRVSTAGNKKFGTPNSGTKLNDWGIRLILTWLSKPAFGLDDTPNYTRLRSVGLLKELIAYDKDINADRISAMSMLMIYREDVYQFIGSNRSSLKTMANNSFWDKHLTLRGRENKRRRDDRLKKKRFNF